MQFDVKMIEDCFDGSRVYEYRLEEPVSKDIIDCVAQIGDLQYFKDFPKPFFRIILPSGSQIKGVKGETGFRAVFSKKGMPLDKDRIEKIVQEMNCNN